MGDICIWFEDEDGVWDTECGGKFEVDNGLPSENQMLFCPYCGKSLQEDRYQFREVGEEEAPNSKLSGGESEA